MGMLFLLGKEYRNNVLMRSRRTRLMGNMYRKNGWILGSVFLLGLFSVAIHQYLVGFLITFVFAAGSSRTRAGMSDLAGGGGSVGAASWHKGKSLQNLITWTLKQAIDFFLILAS